MLSSQDQSNGQRFFEAAGSIAALFIVIFSLCMIVKIVLCLPFLATLWIFGLPGLAGAAVFKFAYRDYKKRKATWPKWRLDLYGSDTPMHSDDWSFSGVPMVILLVSYLGVPALLAVATYIYFYKHCEATDADWDTECFWRAVLVWFVSAMLSTIFISPVLAMPLMLSGLFGL